MDLLNIIASIILFLAGVYIIYNVWNDDHSERDFLDKLLDDITRPEVLIGVGGMLLGLIKLFNDIGNLFK